MLSQERFHKRYKIRTLINPLFQECPMVKLNFIPNPDPNARFQYTTDGRSFEPKHVLAAAMETNNSMREVAKVCNEFAGLDIFDVVDKKVTGSILGSVFVRKFSVIAKDYLGLNPSQTGNPDLIPAEYLGQNDEGINWDQFPYGGIEVKTSCGDIPTGVTWKLKNRESRIEYLQNVVWKGHHTAINNLLGLYWDYCEQSPMIMATFYSNELVSSDFTNTIPKPGGGHTTSVCITKSSAIAKMGRNWVFIVDLPDYIKFFKNRFGINAKSEQKKLT
jgi:muconolactone delta-isomerase